MKTLLALLLSASSILAAEPVAFIGGKTYREATISAEPGMVVKIAHRDGTARLRAWDLDAAWQRRLGFNLSAVESERRRLESEARMRAAEELRQAEIRRMAEEKRLAEKVKADAAQAETEARAAREWQVKERQRRERAVAENEQFQRDFEAWRASRQSSPEAANAVLREWARQRYLQGK